MKKFGLLICCISLVIIFSLFSVSNAQEKEKEAEASAPGGEASAPGPGGEASAPGSKEASAPSGKEAEKKKKK